MYTVVKSSGQLEWVLNDVSQLYAKNYILRALFKDKARDDEIGQIYVDMGSEDKPDCTIITAYATGKTGSIFRTPSGIRRRHYVKLGKLIKSIIDTSSRRGLEIYNIKMIDKNNKIIREWLFDVC